jgi:hypothetical protein
MKTTCFFYDSIILWLVQPVVVRVASSACSSSYAQPTTLHSISILHIMIKHDALLSHRPPVTTLASSRASLGLKLACYWYRQQAIATILTSSLFLFLFLLLLL